MNTIGRNATASLPDVVNVFQTMLASLSPGSARLDVERQENGEVRVKLTPSNPHAATILARGRGKMGYDVIAGNGTLFEIILKPKAISTPVVAAEELRAICLAIIAGDFEETVYTVGKKTVKTVGKLTIAGKTTKTRQWHDFYPLIPKKKQVIKYAPYVG